LERVISRINYYGTGFPAYGNYAENSPFTAVIKYTVKKAVLPLLVGKHCFFNFNILFDQTCFDQVNLKFLPDQFS